MGSGQHRLGPCRGTVCSCTLRPRNRQGKGLRVGRTGQAGLELRAFRRPPQEAEWDGNRLLPPPPESCGQPRRPHRGPLCACPNPPLAQGFEFPGGGVGALPLLNLQLAPPLRGGHRRPQLEEEVGGRPGLPQKPRGACSLPVSHAPTRTHPRQCLQWAEGPRDRACRITPTASTTKSRREPLHFGVGGSVRPTSTLHLHPSLATPGTP